MSIVSATPTTSPTRSRGVGRTPTTSAARRAASAIAMIWRRRNGSTGMPSFLLVGASPPAQGLHEVEEFLLFLRREVVDGMQGRRRQRSSPARGALWLNVAGQPHQSVEVQSVEVRQLPEDPDRRPLDLSTLDLCQVRVVDARCRLDLPQARFLACPRP